MPTKRFEHGGLRLLDLQEQRVVVVAAQQQHDVAAGPHAAHAHHFVSRVDVAVLLDGVVLVPEGAPVGGEQLLDQRSGIFPFRSRLDQVLDRDDDGRVGDDPQLAVDLVCSFGEHPGAVARPRLRDHFLKRLALDFADSFNLDFLADQLEEHPGFQVVIPCVQPPDPGGLAHPVPVLRDPGHDHGAPVGRGEAAVAPHDLEAGRETLHVPFPRPGQGLVEIVDIEQHPPFGGAEQTEVRQMGVTAHLHRHARHRGRCQIGRHDQRGAPVERERRDQHPPVPDGHQLGNPALRLLLQQRDWIRAAWRGLPSSVARPGRLVASGPAPGQALIHGQVLTSPGRRKRRTPRAVASGESSSGEVCTRRHAGPSRAICLVNRVLAHRT